ncbi:hypothetical protein HYT00_02950 [Candidatus Giovannonibacteria bacterium]|nr:hypothetical protein [Candidatus Giovannonibacteria bacterium]
MNKGTLKESLVIDAMDRPLRLDPKISMLQKRVEGQKKTIETLRRTSAKRKKVARLLFKKIQILMLANSEIPSLKRVIEQLRDLQYGHRMEPGDGT